MYRPKRYSRPYVYPYQNRPHCYCWQPPMIQPYYQYTHHPNDSQMYGSSYWNLNQHEMKRVFDRPNIELKDHGKNPFVININEAARHNRNYRTAIWTGDHLQVTVMSLHVGEDIGLEVHPDTDQFLRIEEGEGIVQMGKTRNSLTFERKVSEDDAIFVPAGYWHNLTNTGYKPLKLYSIYAPPEHPFGTVHRTKAEAMAEENYNV